MYNYGHNKLEEIINRRASASRVLIWSAFEKSEKNDCVFRFFKNRGIEVYGCINGGYRGIKEYNGYKVYSRDIIKNGKFFIYVTLDNTYNDILYFLEENGCREYTDFWYPKRRVYITGYQPYSDLYGNVYRGYGYNVPITLSKGGKCVFGKNIRIDKTAEIRVEENSMLNVAEGCTVDENVHISLLKNSKCILGRNSSISEMSEINVCGGSLLNIAETAHISQNVRIDLVDSSTANIDKGCVLCNNYCIKSTRSSKIDIGERPPSRSNVVSDIINLNNRNIYWGAMKYKK